MNKTKKASDGAFKELRDYLRRDHTAIDLLNGAARFFGELRRANSALKDELERATAANQMLRGKSFDDASAITAVRNELATEQAKRRQVEAAAAIDRQHFAEFEQAIFSAMMYCAREKKPTEKNFYADRDFVWELMRLLRRHFRLFIAERPPSDGDAFSELWNQAQEQIKELPTDLDHKTLDEIRAKANEFIPAVERFLDYWGFGKEASPNDPKSIFLMAAGAAAFAGWTIAKRPAATLQALLEVISTRPEGPRPPVDKAYVDGGVPIDANQ